MKHENNSTEVQPYNLGSNRYSIVHPETRTELCVVRGERRARAVLSAVREAKTSSWIEARAIAHSAKRAYDAQNPRHLGAQTMAHGTIAERLSALVDDDGRVWETADGRDFVAILEEHAAYSLAGEDSRKYLFGDDSSIIVTPGGWDLGVDGCSGFCWAGIGCTCDDEG